METRATENPSPTAHGPMTAAQRACLERLCREAGEDFDTHEHLTAAEAAQRIEALRRQVRWMVARQPSMAPESAGL